MKKFLIAILATVSLSAFAMQDSVVTYTLVFDEGVDVSELRFDTYKANFSLDCKQDARNTCIGQVIIDSEDVCKNDAVIVYLEMSGPQGKAAKLNFKVDGRESSKTIFLTPKRNGFHIINESVRLNP